MIDYNILDLSKKDDLLKIVRDAFHYIDNLQWLLFGILILLGILVGISLARMLMGGGKF